MYHSQDEGYGDSYEDESQSRHVSYGRGVGGGGRGRGSFSSGPRQWDSQYTYTDNSSRSNGPDNEDFPALASSGPSSSSHQFSSPAGQDQEQDNSRRNLIVNYLPQHLNDRDLYELFSSFGHIEHARVMKDRKTGYSFGFGFVNFSQEIEATEAINGMNGRRIDHKVLKVSLARPSCEEIKDTNLYVSNLKREITDAELREMFSPFGEIVHQNILQDKYTGLPRGVAFVRYARREQANAALESMNNFMPEGSTESIRVKLAENHGKQKAAYVAGFQAGYHQGGPPAHY